MIATPPPNLLPLELYRRIILASLTHSAICCLLRSPPSDLHLACGVCTALYGQDYWRTFRADPGLFTSTLFTLASPPGSPCRSSQVCGESWPRSVSHVVNIGSYFCWTGKVLPFLQCLGKGGPTFPRHFCRTDISSRIMSRRFTPVLLVLPR